MGRYIAKVDIEAVFGADNVAAWSNLDNTQASADERRIDVAIAFAEAAVDDRFRGGPYAIPFAPAPAIVKDWAAKLAGAWLQESRGAGAGDATGSSPAAVRQRVEAEMATYLTGQRRLDALRRGGDPSAPVVVE